MFFSFLSGVNVTSILWAPATRRSWSASSRTYAMTHLMRSFVSGVSSSAFVFSGVYFPPCIVWRLSFATNTSSTFWAPFLSSPELHSALAWSAKPLMIAYFSRVYLPANKGKIMVAMDKYEEDAVEQGYKFKMKKVLEDLKQRRNWVHAQVGTLHRKFVKMLTQS